MTLFKTAAALGAASFVAYCFYFDYKRRSHPDFKKNLKKRRAQEKKDKDRSVDELFEVPAFESPTEMQQYFMEQISIGDELLQRGSVELGAIHLAKALVVCSQKQELLSTLNRSLPEPVFQMILKCYQKANDRFITKMLLNQEIARQVGSLFAPSTSSPSAAIKSAPEGLFEDADIE